MHDSCWNEDRTDDEEIASLTKTTVDVSHNDGAANSSSQSQSPALSVRTVQDELAHENSHGWVLTSDPFAMGGLYIEALETAIEWHGIHLCMAAFSQRVYIVFECKASTNGPTQGVSQPPLGYTIGNGPSSSSWTPGMLLGGPHSRRKGGKR